MKLIMNADDFGLTDSVNLAIADCFEAGIVQSTTVMMNQPGTAHAAQIYQQGLVNNVGLHFTVTAGRPLMPASEVPSLVDENGYFLSKSELLNKRDVCSKEVMSELEAQYSAAIEAGFELTHIDTHHFGGIYPGLKQAFIQFANRIGIPVRRVDFIVPDQQGLSVATPDVFDARFFDAGATLSNLQTLLLEHKQQFPEGCVEFMCHPACEVTDELTSLSGYLTKRVEEWQLLTSPELKSWLKQHDIQCVSFNHI
ncbi:carbohydrate deacetylase [Vibrio europaeus]|uniref:carbohydrate deacetylase n=1 Tax=Vibrio europaeus TaxID=300876 RepID=UPI00148CA87C|nr:carbohydrate deacetylase [Vibrio europaeus]MDC5818960.1 carbohydrate deacetylase [Vibrio europaeus]MDC5871016.1 carbohydrate deacetylase [Vibrio europaeus]NOH21598.1 carbohydrate deacetylase [Vibrio europaeus]